MTTYGFQQKRGTSAQWAARTEPLHDGEIGIDKDTGVIKVGDGVKLWADLDPIMGSQYLPLLGKANDSYRLDGLASTDFLRSDGMAVDSTKLGGQTPDFYMPASAAGSFLAATGKAADSDLLDGMDSAAFLGVNATAADSAKLGGNLPSYFAKASDVRSAYWGAMTSFPNGALPGDTVIRSDIGTNGSFWLYTGPGKGTGGWVHKGPIVCTSSTRPPSSGASSVAYGGLEIFETDTGRSYRWVLSGTPVNGSSYKLPASVWDQFAGPPEVYAFNYGGNPFQDLINTSAGWQPFVAYKMGRNVWAEGTVASASSAGSNLTAGNNYTLGTFPAAVKPMYNMQQMSRLWAPGNNTAIFTAYTDASVQLTPYAACSNGWDAAVNGMHWTTLG